MAQEIERKFLVIGEFKSSAFAQSHIVQGYISSARGRTVRVRIRDEKGYLTIKGASNASGTSRYEWEKELALSEAEELMRLCEPGIIDKTRYLVRSGKHVFEVDEHYRTKKQVQDYADMLHKSPKTLSNIFSTCKLPSPLRVIHERVEAEAKRLLLYSNKSAKEIADILGFEDQASFSRFFKNMTGQSAVQFRNTQEGKN